MAEQQNNSIAFRLVVSLSMAGIGASLFLLFLSRDLPGGLTDEWAAENLPLVMRYVFAMAIGGAIMGLVVSGLFGRLGLSGWFLAILGGVLATLVAGAFGSFIGLVPDILSDGWQSKDLIPILFGFLVLPLAAAENLGSTVIWIVMVLATHLLARKLRK